MSNSLCAGHQWIYSGAYLRSSRVVSIPIPILYELEIGSWRKRNKGKFIVLFLVWSFLESHYRLFSIRRKQAQFCKVDLDTFTNKSTEQPSCQVTEPEVGQHRTVLLYLVSIPQYPTTLNPNYSREIFSMSIHGQGDEITTWTEGGPYIGFGPILNLSNERNEISRTMQQNQKQIPGWPQQADLLRRGLAKYQTRQELRPKWWTTPTWHRHLSSGETKCSI